MGALTLLALDLTGQALANRVTGEPHSLITVSASSNRVVMLDRGGFYEANLKVYDANGRSLTPGTDFVPTYLYDDLSEMTGQAVYGMIVIKNAAVSAQVTVDYRAVGGVFGLSVKELRALLVAVADENLTVKYSDIIDRPTAFIPGDHTHEWWQVYAMDSTIAELNRIGEATKSSSDAVEDMATAYGKALLDDCQKVIDDYAKAAAAHYADTSNPHAVTKVQVGLSNLNNWSIVTAYDATLSGNDSIYLSPGVAYQILANAYIPQINTHIANKNNPHRVTAAQLQAYTRAQTDAKLAQYLDRTATAANSNLVGGYDYNTMAANVRTNIPTANVVSGIFDVNRLGSNGGNNDTVLMGNSNFRSVQNLFDTYQSSAGSSIFIGRFNGYQAAEAQLNANYTNLTSFPIGTLAFANIYNGLINAGSVEYFINGVELQYWQRTGSGWLRMSGQTYVAHASNYNQAGTYV